MTKREFEIEHIAFEQGMIKAWEGIKIHADLCIVAHRKELTKERVRKIVSMNNHLYKKS